MIKWTKADTVALIIQIIVSATASVATVRWLMLSGWL